MNTKEEFIEAIEADEYAEYELSTGDVLITDYEGDGLFHPYVVPKNDNEGCGDEIADAISEEFDVRVFNIEATGGNETIFYPVMKVPTK
jgi:hypothetical protein